MEIKNWKQKLLINELRVVDEDSAVFLEKKLTELNLPSPPNQPFSRSETCIDWSVINPYHSFFFDELGNEDKIKTRLLNSELKNAKNVIVIYGWGEPTISISTLIFISDWEEIFASTVWQTVIFSDDYKLIMEVSRDYILHSNFPI